MLFDEAWDNKYECSSRKFSESKDAYRMAVRGGVSKVRLGEGLTRSNDRILGRLKGVLTIGKMRMSVTKDSATHDMPSSESMVSLPASWTRVSTSHTTVPYQSTQEPQSTVEFKSE